MPFQPIRGVETDRLRLETERLRNDRGDHYGLNLRASRETVGTNKMAAKPSLSP